MGITGSVLVLGLGVWVADASHFPIDTVAGGGDLLGDGGFAADAILAPTDSVRDSAGNTYIADTFANRVRKVNPDGIITTIAGTGKAGFSGDGSQATDAQLNQPYGVTIDGSGNVYIADSLNDRIRKISTAGTITTVAGGGNDLREGIPATQAALWTPYRVTFRSGELFISDTGNHKIRKVDSQGIITTFAGSVSGFGGDGGSAASAELNLPWKIVFDTVGNAFIADAANHRIRRVDPQGIITTFAGNGVAGISPEGATTSESSFYHPVDITIDESGSMYVADLDNKRVRKISSGAVTTFAGGATATDQNETSEGVPATSAYLDRVWGVSFAEKMVFVSSGRRVRRVDEAGIIRTFAGGGGPCFGGDTGPATRARLCYPRSVTSDGAGNLYIADTLNRRIRRVSAGTITTIAGDGRAGDAGDGGPALQASFIEPVAAVSDSAGGIYVLDSQAARVRYIDAQGIISTIAGSGQPGYSGDGGPAAQATLQAPQSIALGIHGDLYIVDTGNHRIRRVGRSDGVIRTVAGDGTPSHRGDGGPAVGASLYSPLGMALDHQGAMYIADTGNRRIRKVDVSGNISTILGGDLAEGIHPNADVSTSVRSLIYPTSVTVDPEGTRVIFVDEFGSTHRCPSGDTTTCSPDWAVMQIDGFGSLTQLAGGNGQGFSGDGGPASKARFNQLESVFLSSDGKLTMADSGNNRIRNFQIDPVTSAEREAHRSRSTLQGLKETLVDPKVEEALSAAGDARKTIEDTVAEIVEDSLTTVADASALIGAGIDQVINQTKRVSTSSSGGESNDRSDQPRISGDGRYVAFVSSGSNLAPEDLNGSTDVFVKEIASGATQLVSVSTGGLRANGPSFQPSISRDGRFIAFTSAASNLVEGDSNARDDVFLRDRDSDSDGKFDESGDVSTSMISLALGGVPANGQSGHPAISSDGRYLAFASLATDLAAGDLNAMADVFLRDLQLGLTARISLGLAEGNGHSIWPSVADDGTVAFESWASNLVTGDTNGVADVFVGDATGVQGRVSLRSDGGEASLDSSGAVISGDGRSIAFHTAAPGMISTDANKVHDVFVRSWPIGELKHVSVGLGGESPNGGSASASLSWDGRFVAFGSGASNLIANDFNLAIDVFVRDLQLNISRRSSVGHRSGESNGLSMFPSITHDGWRVAFQSDASNLVDGDANSVTDIFVRMVPF